MNDHYSRLLVAASAIALISIIPATAQSHRLHLEDRGGDVSGNPYCAPLFFNDGSPVCYIDGVNLGTIAWTGTGFSGLNGYNDDFFDGPGSVTSLEPGGSYILGLTLAGIYTANSYCYAWLDTDADGVFEVSELIGQVQGSDPGAQVNISFSVPTSASVGYTGLRVICVLDAQPSPDPCGGYAYGETEDYAVLLADQSPCMPIYSQGTSEGDFIAAFHLGPYSGTAGYQGLYPYTAPNGAFHLQTGQSYDLTITSGIYPQDTYKTWVDWNADGDWDDAGELIGDFESTGTNSVVTQAFTVPDTVWGWFPVRVRCSFNLPLAPCDDQVFGETRDYMIVVNNPLLPCLTYNYLGSSNGYGLQQVDVNGSVVPVNNAPPNHRIGSSDPVVHVLPGGSLSVTATINALFEGNLVVGYVDLNNDLDFDDAGEATDYNFASGPNAPIGFILNVPAGTVPGGHWLRVSAYGPGFEFAYPCSDPSQGQVVDILFIVDDPNGPCIPGSVFWTSEGDFIDGVQLGDITTQGTGTPYGPVYTDYSTLSTELITSHAYQLAITSGAFQLDTYYSWIDYNDDNDFDDANELLGTAVSSTPFQDLSILFTVPLGTPLGQKRMRVRCVYNDGADPCADVPYGETEDYRVDIETNTGIAESADAGWSVQVVNGGEGIVVNRSNGPLVVTPILLLDAAGRVVRRFNAFGTRTEVAVGDLAVGLYTVRMDQDNAVGSQKVMIIR